MPENVARVGPRRTGRHDGTRGGAGAGNVFRELPERRKDWGCSDGRSNRRGITRQGDRVSSGNSGRYRGSESITCVGVGWETRSGGKYTIRRSQEERGEEGVVNDKAEWG